MFAGREIGWADIVSTLASSRHELRSAVEGSTGRALAWMSERAMEEVDHYRVHASQLRAFVERR